MKKIILFVLDILTCIIFITSFSYYIKFNNFSTKNVVKNISYLSSDYFKGRLAGTLENTEAAKYIKDSFVNSKLLPYMGNYYETFSCLYPETIGSSPYLLINDKKGTTIKTYNYGTDYKEDLLNFRSNNFEISDKSSLYSINNCSAISAQSGRFILYAPGTMNFRSSFISNSDYNMYIVVSPSVLNEIRNYVNGGDTLKCYIPIINNSCSVQNVTGVIKGRNRNLPPIIISAHFDHVGTDLSGNVFSGALDNASGISFILELADYLQNLGTPERDIIFAGFNAEEFGCVGSQNFIIKNYQKIKGAKVYNFDMVGSNKNIPISIVSGAKDNKNTSFVKSIDSICSSLDIKYKNSFADDSDHEFFRKCGIDAATFCDDDTSKIHTTDDKVQYISKNSIARCFKIVRKDIVSKDYPMGFLIIHSKLISFVSLTLTMILSIVIIVDKSIFKDLKKKNTGA